MVVLFYLDFIVRNHDCMGFGLDLQIYIYGRSRSSLMGHLLVGDFNHNNYMNVILTLVSISRNVAERFQWSNAHIAEQSSNKPGI